MLKFAIQIKEVEDTLNIQLLDPTEKQLNSATNDERAVAQAIKELFDEHLLNLLEENKKQEK